MLLDEQFNPLNDYYMVQDFCHITTTDSTNDMSE